MLAKLITIRDKFELRQYTWSLLRLGTRLRSCVPAICSLRVPVPQLYQTWKDRNPHHESNYSWKNTVWSASRTVFLITNTLLLLCLVYQVHKTTAWNIMYIVASKVQYLPWWLPLTLKYYEPIVNKWNIGYSVDLFASCVWFIVKMWNRSRSWKLLVSLVM
jgi:hypothetical protein